MAEDGQKNEHGAEGQREPHHHHPEQHHHSEHHRHHEHEHPEYRVTIVINGNAEAWHHHAITYEEVVKLAFPDGPIGGDIRYSVSWTRPDGQEGSLRPGRSVEVVERMMFHVRNTDKS